MSENSQETSAYAGYSGLAFDRPAKGVLRITLDRPERLNALDARGHDELARVWRDVDENPSVAAVILCGAGKMFSAGGDFDMVEEMIHSFDARVRVWRDSKDLVDKRSAVGDALDQVRAQQLAAPGGADFRRVAGAGNARLWRRGGARGREVVPREARARISRQYAGVSTQPE